MFLLQTVPYLRKQDSFTSADSFGYWVAHQDITAAALQYTDLEGVHFYLPFAREYSRTEIADGVNGLRRQFPGRQIEVKRVSELDAMARIHRYALLDDFESFPVLALSRFSDAQCLFPVTTVVHTVPRHLGLISYFSVLLLAESCDAVITTSEAGRRAVETILEDVESFARERLGGADPAKPFLRTIPLAVDERFLCPGDSAQARKELDLPASRTIIGYIGRLSETYKADLEPLLVTFRRLLAEHPDLHLLIAGQDQKERYAAVLHSLAQELGVGDRLSIITNFPYGVKPKLYRASDIFVSPADNFQETFGLSILEAMASSVPVIASDWSGYRDLVVHGRTGFLVKTAWNERAGRVAELVAPFPIRSEHFLAQQTIVDGQELYLNLKRLIENPGLRSQMGEAGRERVLSKFSWRAVIQQYQELWREQWAKRETLLSTRTWQTPLNFRKQFGHFASGNVDEGTVLKAAEGLAPGPSGRQSYLDPSRVPYPLETREVQKVLSQCQHAPQSLESLMRQGSEMTASAAIWLWKKGYLEPDFACCERG